MRLERAAYYCLAPILCLDSQWRIADFNLALDSLMPTHLDGWRNRAAIDWVRRMESHCTGDLLAPAITRLCQDSSSTDAICSGQVLEWTRAKFESETYGQVGLEGSAVRLTDQTTGHFAGTVVSWQVTGIDNADAYRARLQQIWNHQLVWESYATSYDEILPRLVFYTEVRDRHVAAMSTANISRIADLGAGTGNVTVPLVHSGREVLAVDLSRAMLEKLRTKFPPADTAANSLMLAQANAQRLPQLASSSVDGVTILLALYDMDRPHEALAEAIRILRPGGTMVITEPKLCFDLGFLLQHAEALLKAQVDYELLHAHFQRVFHANRELDPTARADRLRAEDIHHLLIDRGFRSVTMADSHLGQCATIIGTKPAGGSE